MTLQKFDGQGQHRTSCMQRGRQFAADGPPATIDTVANTPPTIYDDVFSFDATDDVDAPAPGFALPAAAPAPGPPMAVCSQCIAICM